MKKNIYTKILGRNETTAAAAVSQSIQSVLPERQVTERRTECFKKMFGQIILWKKFPETDIDKRGFLTCHAFCRQHWEQTEKLKHDVTLTWVAFYLIKYFWCWTRLGTGPKQNGFSLFRLSGASYDLVSILSNQTLTKAMSKRPKNTFKMYLWKCIAKQRQVERVFNAGQS